MDQLNRNPDGRTSFAFRDAGASPLGWFHVAVPPHQSCLADGDDQLSQRVTAHLIFEAIGLAELKTAAPDRWACREVFEHAYTIGRRCALPGLAQGAARAIARIADENLNDPAEALRLAAAMAAEIGQSPGQDDGRASILLSKGDTAEVLAIWRELLPCWTPRDEFDLQQPFSHRLAAIAAARLGEWTEAADWLRGARAMADEVKQATFRAGLLVDEGFARWKGGDSRGALDCLVEGLAAVERLPADEIDERAYPLRKRAGYTILWIAKTTAGAPLNDFAELPSAWCSSLEPLKEAGLSPMPSDAMWAHLLEFEFVAKLGDKQFRRHEARLKGSRYGLVRFAFDQLRLQHRLRCVALDDFVEVVGDWIDSFALCRRYYYKENCLGPTDPLPVNAATPDRQEVDGELVLSMMVNDVFALAARGALTKDVIERLTVSATSAGLSAILEPWLVFVSGLFIDSTINAEVAVRDTSRAWPYQAAASIRVATDGATRPAELLTIHGYWAVVLPQAGRGLLVLADIEKLVTNAWLRLSENSFLLRASAVTLPVLREACAGASTGWRKIGEVLTAACDAVPPPVPVEIRERFRKLRQYGGSGDKKLSLALPAVTSGLGNGRNGANPAVRARWRQRRLWVD